MSDAASPLQLPGSKTGIYVAAVVGLSVLGVAGIVAIVLARPNEDNTALVTLVLGFLVPTILGFMGVAIKEVHVAFNSRMSELLELTARSARAEGELRASGERAAGQAAGVEQERIRTEERHP